MWYIALKPKGEGWVQYVAIDPERTWYNYTYWLSVLATTYITNTKSRLGLGVD